MATINSRNINLTTPLDEYAAEIFINRKEGESLENFEERTRLGYENLYKSGYEAFEASLDYITTERTREIFEIEILVVNTMIKYTIFNFNENKNLIFNTN